PRRSRTPRRGISSGCSACRRPEGASMRHIRLAICLVATAGFGLAHAGSYEDFFQAMSRDDGNAVRAWVQRGIDPNSRDPDGQTALYLALRSGAFGAADALLAAPGLDVNAVNSADESA